MFPKCSQIQIDAYKINKNKLPMREKKHHMAHCDPSFGKVGSRPQIQRKSS